MTNVTFIKVGGLYTGFHLKGHACYNPNGPDILCSAISMGAQMTELGLREVANCSVNETVGDGLYTIIICKGSSNETAQALMETFHKALENLQAQYSDFISVSLVGE